MSQPSPTRDDASPFNRKYLWPTPVGLVLWISGLGVAKAFGQRAFLSTHAFFEIGIMIALLASVAYALRLGGKGKKLAPRWVFYLNLLFGPLILALVVIAGMASLLSGR